MALNDTRFPMGFTLVSVFLVVLLIGLGAQQLISHNWRDKVVTFSQERLTAPPVPLKEDMGRPWDYAFRIVTARGKFLHDKELLITGQVHGGRVGFRVITPLMMADDKVLFIDRGWVPVEKKDPVTRAEGQIEGDVEITGALRAPAHRGLFRPANDPINNKWHGVDPRLMTESLKLNKFRPFYLEAGPTPNPGGLPIGGYTPYKASGQPMLFAIAWFAIAFGVVLVYAERLRRYFRNR